MPETVPEMFLATVVSVSAAGVELTMDGETAPMTKRYKRMATGAALNPDDRVVVVKISGTFVVLGAIQ